MTCVFFSTDNVHQRLTVIAHEDATMHELNELWHSALLAAGYKPPEPEDAQ
jgi:hypothetical protein